MKKAKELGEETREAVERARKDAERLGRISARGK